MSDYVLYLIKLYHQDSNIEGLVSNLSVSSYLSIILRKLLAVVSLGHHRSPTYLKQLYLLIRFKPCICKEDHIFHRNTHPTPSHIFGLSQVTLKYRYQKVLVFHNITPNVFGDYILHEH